MATYSATQTGAQESYDRTNTIAAGGNFNVSDDVFALRIGADNTTLDISDSVILNGPGYNSLYPCSSAIVFGDLTYNSNNHLMDSLFNAVITFSSDRPIEISNTSGGDGGYSHVYGIVGNDLTFGTAANPSIGSNVSIRTAAATAEAVAGNNVVFTAAIRNTPTETSVSHKLVFTGDLNAAISASAVSGRLNSSDWPAILENKFSGTDASAYGIMANNSMNIGGSFNGSFAVSAKAGEYVNTISSSATLYARAYATAIQLKGYYGGWGDLTVGSDFAGTVQVLAEGGVITAVGSATLNSDAEAYGIHGASMTVGGDFSTSFDVRAVGGKNLAGQRPYGTANVTAAAVSLVNGMSISGNFSAQGTVLAEGGTFVTDGAQTVTEAYGLYHRGKSSVSGDEMSSFRVTAKSGSIGNAGDLGNFNLSATASAWFEGADLQVSGNSGGTLQAEAFGGSVVSAYKYSNILRADASARAFDANFIGKRNFDGRYEKTLIASAVGGNIAIGAGSASASASAVGFYAGGGYVTFQSSVSNVIDVSAKAGTAHTVSTLSANSVSAVAEASGFDGGSTVATFHSAFSGSWSVLAQGGSAYSSGSPVSAYSSAYGLKVYSLYGNGALGGTISVTAQGGWSSATPGQTRRRDNGIATGIYVGYEVQNDQREKKAFTISGNVIANGEQYANGIVAKAMNLTVSGTVFAGSYNISVDSTAEQLNAATADLENLLARADDNLSILKDAVQSAQGYAVYAGSYTAGTNMVYSAGIQNDTLNLVGNAKVFGNIDLTAGTNIFTLSNNAFFCGDLYATGGTMNVNFTIDGTSSGHVFMTSGNVELLASASASVSVDVSKALAGVYYLMDSGNLASIAGKKFLISCNNEKYQFSIGSSAVFGNEFRVGLLFADEAKTKLALVVEDIADREKPMLSGDPITVSMQDSTLSFMWTPATDNVGVTGYVVEWNGKEYEVSTPGCSISDAVAGTEYTIRYCAVDAAGNRSDWSQPFSYTVPVAPPEKDTAIPELAQNSAAAIRYEGSTAYIAWNAATDNVGVAGYCVEFDGQLYQTAEPSLRLDNVSYGTHTVRYYAYDAAGNKSAWSAVSSAELAAPEPEPTGPELTKEVKTSLNNKSYKVKFSWGKAVLAKGEKLQGYEVVLDGVSQGLVKSTSFSPKDLVSVGSHTFKVRAVNQSGELGAWYEDSFDVWDVTAPTGKMKIYANPQVENGQYVVDLSWDAMTDNVGVAGYRVAYGVGKNLIEHEAAGTSFRIPDAVAGKLTLQVYAYDAVGNKSKITKSSLNIKDMIAPDVVRNLGCVMDEKKYKATLTWDTSMDNGGTVKAAGYYITYSTDENFANSVTKKSTKTSFNLSKLQANTTYFYKVTAYDKAKNESADSQVYSFFVKDVTPPSKPSIQVKKTSENLYQLTWKTPKDNVAIAGYEVRYTTASGDLNNPLQSWKTMENGASLTLTRAGSYIVQMCAYDTSGNAAYSSVKKITVKTDMALSYSSASDLNLNFGNERSLNLGIAAV